MTITRPSIFVKVPFCQGQHRFKILKGQNWGAVDHLLLQEVVNQPCSAQELAEQSNLPRRLIIEIMIPFMRVGWIQLSKEPQHYVFQATTRGIIVSQHAELPVEKEPIISFRQFIIDPATGDCYRVGSRQQSFQVYSNYRSNEILREKKSLTAELNFKSPHTLPDLTDIYECVAEADEEVISYEEHAIEKPYSQTVKFAIAVVDEFDNITGLPAEASGELRSQIIDAAHKKLELIKLLGDQSDSKSSGVMQHDAISTEQSYIEHSLSCDQYELILGAEHHQQHLLDTIETAHSRLIIHSTFISTSNLEKIIPHLLEAAKRSVQIDILWGQVEPDDASKTQQYEETLNTLKSLNQMVIDSGLSTLLTFHIEPTNSHAKFIISDTQSKGYSATVGSCNWLASGFNRFEASVNVQHPGIVIELLTIASRLSRGLSRVSNSLSRELAVLANQLKSKNTQLELQEQASGDLTAKLVLKTYHHEYLRKARDEATQDIFVCSHRLSHFAERPIIAPLIASVNQHETIAAQVYYGALSGGLKANEAAMLSDKLGALGIKIEKANRPMIHAKILTWDDSHAVVTSLNWLSASTTGNNYDEIGIYLQGDDVAKKIKAAFTKYTK